MLLVGLCIRVVSEQQYTIHDASKQKASWIVLLFRNYLKDNLTCQIHRHVLQAPIVQTNEGKQPNQRTRSTVMFNSICTVGFSQWDKLLISQFRADAGLIACQPTECELHQGREIHCEGICSELSGDK